MNTRNVYVQKLATEQQNVFTDTMANSAVSAYLDGQQYHEQNHVKNVKTLVLVLLLLYLPF